MQNRVTLEYLDRTVLHDDGWAIGALVGNKRQRRVSGDFGCRPRAQEGLSVVDAPRSLRGSPDCQ